MIWKRYIIGGPYYDRHPAPGASSGTVGNVGAIEPLAGKARFISSTDANGLKNVIVPFLYATMKARTL
jgi:hypothetical protein